jgi:arylsulfatase A-like enzyme
VRDLSSILRRGLSLFLVLALTKAIVLGLRLGDGESPLQTLTFAKLIALPAALWGQDLLFVLSFMGGEWLTRRLWPRGRLFTLLYGATTLYSASNVPVMRMFGTPLTFPILNAAGPALLDSLRLYLTTGNVLGCAGVLLAALLLPRLLRRAIYFTFPELARLRRMLLGAVLVACVLSALSSRGRPAELAGLGRNAIYALLRTTLQQRSEASPTELPALPTLPPLPALPAPVVADSPAANPASLVGAARGRDVLWIVLESTAARYLPAYAHRLHAGPTDAEATADPMPTLSRLAAGGVQFDAIYAAYPESIKGLYSQLCSTVPAAHTTAPHYAQARRPCDSVAARFAAAGYHTAMFHSGWFAYLGMADIVADRGFALLKDAGDIGGRYQTSFGVDEGSTVDQILAYFDARPPGQPAFVMYLPIAGHHPYQSPGPKPRPPGSAAGPTDATPATPDTGSDQAGRPQPFGTDSEIAHYRNDLFLGDQALARLWQGLAQRGRLERLAVVVSGDHGEAFRQHPGNFGHTLYLYEENVHVPLFLIVPGITDAPAQRPRGGPLHIAQPGSVIDIGPTLSDLAGLPAPSRDRPERNPPGRSGRSLLSDGKSASLGDLAWPHFLTDHALYQLGLRHGDYKFIDEPESGRAQLYDLRADPDERVDLASTDPERVASYRAHLRAWATRQRLLLHTPARRD